MKNDLSSRFRWILSLNQSRSDCLPLSQFFMNNCLNYPCDTLLRRTHLIPIDLLRQIKHRPCSISLNQGYMPGFKEMGAVLDRHGGSRDFGLLVMMMTLSRSLVSEPKSLQARRVDLKTKNNLRYRLRLNRARSGTYKHRPISFYQVPCRRTLRTLHILVVKIVRIW